jgi:hypothetical protein
MKGGTIVLLLASLAVAALATEHAATLPAPLTASADKPEDHTGDFDKLDDRLDTLTARLVELEEKIKARVDPARIIRARSMEAKVVKLEGTGCGKREFQCGGTDPQCVGVLEVCDSIKDCRNGADEAHCELPLKAGDHFEGHMIFDHCTKRRPEGIDFEITSVRKSVAFNAFIKVTANIIIEYEDNKFDGHVALPTVGYYSFGASKLVFNPPEEDRLYLVVDFDGANFDRGVGHIKRDSGDECAKLIFTRKHDD